MLLIYKIKHLASHQPVFQMTYGMAAKNHTYTYNHLAVRSIVVTELSWRRLAETIRQQKFMLLSQRRLRTL